MMRLLSAIALVTCVAFALRAEEPAPQLEADARAAVPKLKAPSNTKFNSTVSDGMKKPTYAPAPAGQALTADGTGFNTIWAFVKGTTIDSTVAGSPVQNGLVLTADGTGKSVWGTPGGGNNAGVLSLTGGGGITVSASTGAVTLGSNETSANTAGTIVMRDGSGNFSAGKISAAGAFNLPATLDAGTGLITQNGTRLMHTFGTQNVFVGTESGNFTMAGGGNTATGYQTLNANTTGNSNTASGDSALYSNTTAGQNVAVGASALYTQSFSNGGIAWNSGNVAVGVEALYSNQSTVTGNGYDNTAVGTQAMRSNTTGGVNTASGFRALYSNTTGVCNTAFGANALISNSGGNFNTAIGNLADVGPGTLFNATAIGNGALANATNKVRIGNTDVTVIEGQVAYTFTSDRNKKENFLPVDGAEVLRKIRGFPLTSWNYVGSDEKPIRHYGVMAQDFYAAFGHDALGTIGTPTTVNSGDIAGILMSAVQKLSEENLVMRDENAAMKKRLADQDARLARMEKMLAEGQPKAVGALAEKQ